MPKPLDDLDRDRLAIMNRLVDQLALERGYDLSEGLAPNLRAELAEEIEAAYEEWFERIQDGEIITPATPLDHLLAELYDLDTEIHEVMEGGRMPGDLLQ